jgi:GTPase
LLRRDTLDRELARFSQLLADKPQLLVLNKADARPDVEELRAELAARTNREVLAISGVSGYGLRELEDRLLELIPVRS